MAATIFRGRIAPLFDSATASLIAEFRDGKEVGIEHVDLGEPDPTAKVQALLERQVDILVCGAISFSTWTFAEERGLIVHSWVTGEALAVMRRVARCASNPRRHARRNAMKVAVSAMGPDPSSEVDPRFGRCAYLTFVGEDGSYEAIPNPYADLGGGAGIQTATLVADKGADALLTGRCGPNAFGTLSAASVRVFTDVTGTVAEAVERFRRGEIPEASGPTARPHEGMGHADNVRGGPRMGRGRGMGHGRGTGHGGGMRHGRGMGSSRGGRGSGGGWGDGPGGR